ncbi:MAG TPA: hypothetical protein ENK62_01475 [Chromatiales bacterium]|nr:hypothetical protein [Chromatiales bacterium]
MPGSLDALREREAFWLELPEGSRVFVDDRLFRTLDGGWKIGKRGRDRCLLYLAELLRSPPGKSGGSSAP